MEIGKEPSAELLLFSLETIKRTLFEMSQNRNGGDIQVLANLLQNDLNTKFYRLTREEVTKAFHLGVREGEQMAINPRTWFDWLNKLKLKSNASRIQISQEGERLAIETKCAEIDKKGILAEFLEICLVDLYEKFCKDEEVVFQGITQVYNWLELNGFILLSLEEKEKLWDKVQKDIEGRSHFVHNEGKMFHPVTICRERTVLDHFEKWRDSNVDLRKEVKAILNE